MNKNFHVFASNKAEATKIVRTLANAGIKLGLNYTSIPDYVECTYPQYKYIGYHDYYKSVDGWVRPCPDVDLITLPELRKRLNISKNSQPVIVKLSSEISVSIHKKQVTLIREGCQIGKLDVRLIKNLQKTIDEFRSVAGNYGYGGREDFLFTGHFKVGCQVIPVSKILEICVHLK